MNVAAFTPWSALAGGLLIGLAATLYMLLFGRIAGVSGILAHLTPPARAPATLERAGFVAGLLAGPFVWALGYGRVPTQTLDGSPALYAVAGAIVGVGVILGNGCTSGHGVCGLARLSKRSFVATLVFMTTAIVVVSARRLLAGG
jgi:hypothetical protein